MGLSEDVAYAVQVADGYLSPLPGGAAFLEGKTVLELAAGRDLGPALVLAGCGAHVIAVGRCLPGWDPQYHPAFYQALLEAARARYPGLHTGPIEEVLRARKHKGRRLECRAGYLDELDSLETASVEVSVSNGVFSHQHDPARACRELARVTRPGGLGFHQVDFRDPRDYSRPLEFLTLSDEAFAGVFPKGNGACGQRLRAHELQFRFEQSGFRLLQFEANMTADPAYLAGLLPRALPVYRDVGAQGLSVLSGRFFLLRRYAVSTEATYVPRAVTGGWFKSDMLDLEVDSAIHTAGVYADLAWRGHYSLHGRKALEVHPVPSLGTAVMLACHGMQVEVVTPAPVEWRDPYHRDFFELLRRRLRRERPELDVRVIEKVLDARAFEPALAARHVKALDQLGELPAEAYDLVLSYRVLRPGADLAATLGHVHRLTRRGGYALHQVDLRVEALRGVPGFVKLGLTSLEHLLAAGAGRGEYVAQAAEWVRAAAAAGFEVQELEADIQGARAAMAELEHAVLPRFEELNRPELHLAGLGLRTYRPLAPHTEYPRVDRDDWATLSHSRSRYALASQLAAGRAVLDVGGAGLGPEMLCQAGAASVLCVDRSAEVLAYAQSFHAHPHLSFRQVDAEGGLPLPDASFDLAVCLEVLEHVRHQRELVRELHRVLKPGGFLVISVPSAEFEARWTRLNQHGNPYHLHVPDRAEFEGLLSVFATRHIFVQLDLVAATVLAPEGGETDKLESHPLPVAWPGVLRESAPGETITFVAVCGKDAALAPAFEPRLYLYENYQRQLTSGLEQLACEQERNRQLEWECFAIRNRGRNLPRR